MFQSPVKCVPSLGYVGRAIHKSWSDWCHSTENKPEPTPFQKKKKSSSRSMISDFVEKDIKAAI